MVQGSKILKVELSDYGSYLGRAEGCFEVRAKTGKIERYPHFQKEIGEAVLKSGSYVSVDALIDLALWNIDTYIVTKRNRVVAVLKNLEDDSHVKTRLCQYEALSNGKGLNIARQILKAKLEGQNAVLKKYGLKPLDPSTLLRVETMESESLESARKKLILIESHNAKRYFNQIFSLFPEKIRPEGRIGYFAHDGINNVFNFCYYILRTRIHKAILKAKLEPYLGWLRSVQFGKPSLVCDIQELYRYIIDDFLIERAKTFHKNDFVVVTDFMMKVKMGKKIHLCDYETDRLADGLSDLFERTVEIPRIKQPEFSKKQTLDTLINEECLLLAKYLRNERKEWKPRLPTI